jgi:hypothetical protein
MSLEATAAALRSRPKLHTEKLVLISLADHHNRSTGLCFPKVATIMRDAMVSRRTAFTCLASLEDQGFIKRHNEFQRAGRQTSNSYELLFLGCKFCTPVDEVEGCEICTGEGASGRTPINRKKEQEGTPPSSDPTASSRPSSALPGDLLGKTPETSSQPKKSEAPFRVGSRKKSRVSAEMHGSAGKERERPAGASEGANAIFEVRAKWTKSAPAHDLAHWLLTQDSAGYEELSRNLTNPGHVGKLSKLVKEFGRESVVEVVQDHFRKDHLGECRSPLVASFPEPPRKHHIVTWKFFRPELEARKAKAARFAA